MRYAGLVRNVMIGREGLSRAVLLELLADAGAAGGASHLTTGNVTFDAEPAELAACVGRLEVGIAAVLGRSEPVIVRPLPELAHLVASDPFAGLDEQDWDCEVAFLPSDAPPLDPARLPAVDAVRVVAARPHELLAAGRRGKRWPGINRILERATGARATARGWSTVRRIVAAGER